MLHSIGITDFADEFGCDWLCSHPLNISNKEYKFQTSRGWNQTKWIVLSSTLFSIPAAYHLYARTQSVFPYMLIATSLISVNYWRNATRGWRRNLDLIVAKITFATGLYIAAKYVQSNHYRFTIVIILCFIPVCYNESTKYVNSGNPAWVKYHFAFHVLLSISGALILRGLTQ